MVKPLTNPFAGRPTPLGTLLSTAGRRLTSELDIGLAAAGFDDLRAAHAPLFMAIDPDGSTVTDLARQGRMTKQAMGELVRYLELHEYVTISVDPSDRRARRIRLTQRGWDAIAAGERVIEDFDRWLASGVGADQVERMRNTLERIIETDGATWRS
jgi:DNA-binding MarR family transcriptional regulator